MRYAHVRYATLFLAVAAAGFAASAVRAGEHDAVLPYVGDDVVAVGFVRLDRIDMAGVLAELKAHGLPAAYLGEIAGGFGEFQAWAKEMVGYGAPTMYAVGRASDFFSHGTAWVLPLEKDAQATRVAGLLLSNMAGKLETRGNRSEIFPNVTRIDAGVVVGAMNEKQLSISSRSPHDSSRARQEAEPREVARAALEALADADAGVALFGDADSKRVIREMWPAAPAPFMEIDGRMLADGRFLAVGVNLPPKVGVQIVGEAGSAADMALFAGAVEKGLALGKAFAVAEIASGTPDHMTRGSMLLNVLPLIKPQVDGARIFVELDESQAEVAAIKTLLLPAVQASREAAQRNQRINSFKQIALAILNYESAQRSYPPAAIRDKDGKPLLSWRVAVLPYLEADSVYKQFHLDEPWDSPHNMALVDQMPAVYADPDPLLRTQIGKGRTTFLVPRGVDSIFDEPEGMPIRKVTDGTSNTILTVEVVPERAVIWTKPDDWEVDAAEPLRGVRRSDRGGFVAGRADGSVQFVDNGIDATTWKSLLTAAGGETIPPQ